MLVLTRKEGEAIIIGDDILITVNKIQKGQVRIAVKAPNEVTVHRLEIYNAIKRKEQEERTLPDGQ